ncbi:MAG: corrinoid protein [Candidatus Hermodarchaeota archaeon]|jgi:5-methyltetrahydrofolate--homocysteine methyltransferase|nr:corrinoid protein [Candidatus Hermodarchaeota archaeon]
MATDIVSKIRDELINCQTDVVLDLVKKGILEGISASVIVNQGLTAGIRVLGDRFEKGEAFLPELAVAAEIMKQALAFLEPHLAKSVDEEALGTIVIGTIQGDIHDIGKSIVATMLTVAGFTVYDLGTDVSPEAFVAKAKEVNAQIIAMSALLTTTMERMQETIDLIERNNLQDQVKVIVGGAPVSQQFAEKIGADGYGVDFNQAVAIAKRIISHKKG